MYRKRLKGRDIIVVDMTHGGMQLCESYKECGSNVVAVDSHNTLSTQARSYLSSRSIPIFKDFIEAVNSCDPSLVALQYSPDREDISLFCGKTGIPLLSHAKAAGLLLSKRLQESRVVEITGAYGKTSTLSHVESILSETGSPSLVMSSTGIKMIDGSGVHLLDDHGSITPAYALKAVSMADERGFTPETFIFEVSLGGLGIGSVGAVLNVPLHLNVGMQRSAFFSKSQMALNLPRTSVLCLNADDAPARKMGLMTSANVNTYSIERENETVTSNKDALYPNDNSMKIIIDGLHTCTGDTVDTRFGFSPNPSFFGKAAVSNFLAASSIALSLEIDEHSVIAGLEKSLPLDNRLISSLDNGCTVISSTATSKEVVMYAISEAQEYASMIARPLHVVIGGKAKTTCGNVDFDGLSLTIPNILPKFGSLGLYGCLGKELVSRGCKGTMYQSRDHAISSLLTDMEKVILVCTN